jgi:ribosome-binding factor A
MVANRGKAGKLEVSFEVADVSLSQDVQFAFAFVTAASDTRQTR